MFEFLGDISLKKFVNDLYKEIMEDNVFDGAAAIAFYLMLAIFPAAIFLIALLPYLPIAHLKEAVYDFLMQVMPENASQLFIGIIENVTSQQKGGILSFGLVFALWSASSGMGSIMQQLNVTYDVTDSRSYIKFRATAIFLTLISVVLIISAFSLIVLGGVMQGWLISLLGRSEAILIFFVIFRWVIIVLLLLLALACIYYFGPDVEQEFKFVTPGSVIGVIVLIGISLLFRFYITNFSDYDATYGSIGAVIVLILWLYIAGLVILLGSEVNALIEHYSSSGKKKGEKEQPERQRIEKRE
jgi:membrane protein